MLSGGSGLLRTSTFTSAILVISFTWPSLTCEFCCSRTAFVSTGGVGAGAATVGLVNIDDALMGADALVEAAEPPIDIALIPILSTFELRRLGVGEACAFAFMRIFSDMIGELIMFIFPNCCVNPIVASRSLFSAELPTVPDKPCCCCMDMDIG